jgi:hypothetical protein
VGELRTFQSFFTIDEAQEFATFLKEEGIDSIIEKDATLDSIIAGESSDKKFHLKIQASDFGKVDLILENYAEKSLNHVGDDHYLFSFTNEELFEILKKPDEWSKQDFLLAKQILKQRGNEVSDEFTDKLKQKRLENLSQPEKGMNIWVVAGYISSLFGGLFGILIGSALSSAKKTLPDGQIIYLFDEQSRTHGKVIMKLGIAILITSTLLLFIRFLR